MWPQIQLATAFDLLIYLAGYAVAIFLGSFVVDKILSRVQPADIAKNCASQGIIGAGNIIGKLERILVLTFVYLNAPTAIAFVLTAKSIVRFESIKDRHFAEYFLMGTLTSITFAVLTGVAFSYLAKVL
jgi:hypothetical protein